MIDRQINNETVLRNPEGFFNTKKTGVFSLAPMNWGVFKGYTGLSFEEVEYTDSPAPIEDLQVASYINANYDKKYAGEHLFRIHGKLTVNLPEAVVRPPFPGFELEKLTFTGFSVLSKEIFDKIMEQEHPYYSMTEEEKPAYEKAYKNNPYSVIPYSETEVDLIIADIRFVHEYKPW